MTMPHERTRSLIQTEEFLKELARDSSLSASIRDEARRLLRHYPDKRLITSLGRFEEYLQSTNPTDPVREVVIKFRHIVLCSVDTLDRDGVTDVVDYKS